VKISEKLRPLSLTKENNFVIPEFDRRACALIKSVLAKMLQLERRLSGSLRSKFGEDRLKIESARDYRMHWLRCDPVRAHTFTHTHARTYVRMDIKWKFSLSNSMYMDWTDNTMAVLVFGMSLLNNNKISMISTTAIPHVQMLNVKILRIGSLMAQGRWL